MKQRLYASLILSLSILSVLPTETKVVSVKPKTIAVKAKNEASQIGIYGEPSLDSYGGTFPQTDPYPGGGGGGGGTTDERLVHSYDLKETTITTVDKYNDITTGNFHSDGWRGSNLIGRYMDININKIGRVNGVYSHFPGYFEYSLLKSGSVKADIDSKSTFTDTTKESFSFNTSVDYYVESKLEAKADLEIVSASVGVGTKTGATFSYGCEYTRVVTQTDSWSIHFTINQDTAKYCPDGYTLSIGRQGIFYEIEGDYQEMSVWWWGARATQGQSRKKFTAVIANPSDFNYCFVYKKKGYDWDYYLKQ